MTLTDEASSQTSAAADAAADVNVGDVVLDVRNIAKAFGQTQALRDCSLTVRYGEIHAILGENGSGKSTLVKILAGIHQPDQGKIDIAGQAANKSRTPRTTIGAGLVTVFQEVLVVGPQNLVENIWLGVDGPFRRRVSERTKRERARDVLQQLLGEVPPLNVPVERLPLSVRQVCGIARALVRDPKLLILDEATSALDVATRDRLFAIMRTRVADGGSVIFISHRMDEIEELADRITVLRSGRAVSTLDRGSAQAGELVRLMTGAEHLTTAASNSVKRRAESDAVVLEARAFRLRSAAEAFDFSLRSGEMVGLAGLEGHGHDDFLRALSGAGSVGQLVRLVDGAEASIKSPLQAATLGVVYVPRDRRSESLFPSLSIRDNFAAATLEADQRGLLVRQARTDERLAYFRDQLAIKLAAPRLPITTLSGGNQQKIVLARWLARNPAVLLLNDPTRGIDLNAKRDLYKLLREITARGVSVVMLSTELDELIELMDRVLIFREGSVSAELGRVALSRERLVASFFGEGPTDA